MIGFVQQGSVNVSRYNVFDRLFIRNIKTGKECGRRCAFLHPEKKEAQREKR